VVGGASYSQNAENRMLIVNGQVLREGDKVAPEVTLEQIRLKEAVLSTKGHRYRIAY
jgi:general secretion pathway protein B